jgi:hypothetical protein
VTKELKVEMESMKQHISNVRKAVRNDRTDFDEFVDDNADEGDDDYKFASVGQGSRFGLNRARRNVSFEHGGVFDMRENS